jgi:hypothetical protein
MLIQIVILQDEDKIITDIVGMSDFRKADELANNLSVQFGRNRVSRTSLTVDELPTFWGSVPPAAEHKAQADGAKRPLILRNGKPSNVLADGTVLEPPRSLP